MPLWLKKILKSVRVPIYLAFLLLGADECFGIKGNIDNNFDFGTFTQTNKQASFVLSYDGLLSSASNLSQSGNVVTAQVTYSTEQNGDNLTFTTSTSSTEIDGCTLTFSNIVPSANNLVLNPGQGKIRTITFGVNVDINGFCTKGTYNVSGIQIDASGSKTGAYTALIPFSITFNEHIEILQTQEMNFGTFWAPTMDGKIIIYPSGGFDVVNVAMADASALSAGRFTISGLINRDVQLSFSDAVLSSGADTMTVTNLNADVGTSFTVLQDNMPISVGGTLNVGASQHSGRYTGTYNLTISY